MKDKDSEFHYKYLTSNFKFLPFGGGRGLGVGVGEASPRRAQCITDQEKLTSKKKSKSGEIIGEDTYLCGKKESRKRKNFRQ